MVHLSLLELPQLELVTHLVNGLISLAANGTQALQLQSQQRVTSSMHLGMQYLEALFTDLTEAQALLRRR